MKPEYQIQYDMRLRLIKKPKLPHLRERLRQSRFVEIDLNSPLDLRLAAEDLARCFKREMKYDFPPYTAREAEYATRDISQDRVLGFHCDIDVGLRGYYHLIGAVGVRRERPPNAPAHWCISWAWIHPFVRRQGILTAAWPHILQRFPEPEIDFPISPAMQAFLRKVGYPVSRDSIAYVPEGGHTAHSWAKIIGFKPNYGSAR
jgi:RimJ/RimL family protein N-acetyltransferase